MKDVLVLGLFGWCGLSLIVYIVTCVSTSWAAMLIAGLVFFPLGFIYGTGITLGWW